MKERKQICWDNIVRITNNVRKKRFVVQTIGSSFVYSVHMASSDRLADERVVYEGNTNQHS